MIFTRKPDYANTPASERRASYGYAPADPGAAPTASIVTPFYDTGDVFRETARSVLRQSLQQWEWIIVNDGSSDPASLALLDEFRDLDSRVRVVDHPQNLGLSAARNTGYREARAALVIQLDSDDLLEPTAIEKWCWYLESHPEYAFAKGYTVGFGAQEYLWDRGFAGGAEFLRMNLVNPTSVVRRAVHEAAGGYDEADRGGLMDWDFWLRCASMGYWGGTIPEYLDWYRRRPSHADLWPDFDEGERQRAYHANLKRKYPSLWAGRFPKPEARIHNPYDAVPDALPCENRLRKGKPRVLMVLPFMACGGADKFSLDALEQLTSRGWEATVATTLNGESTWGHYFARHTPDIFVLENFLRAVDYPRFLRYLIGSRNPDVVLISHSELGYKLLPYLRAHFPNTAFVDYCHIEEPTWLNGGYPRFSVEFQELLDLSVVSSEHLKRWMATAGADEDRIRVCYTNVDTDDWRPDAGARAEERRLLGIGEREPVVLFVGRICAQKQPKVLAETLRRVAETGAEFTALVAGDGQDYRWLSTFVNKHGLAKRVRLLGEVPNERVRRLMAAADVLFLPSMWEGISLTIFEAMACGLAVVGADVGGQRELVTPECGVLVARSDRSAEVAHYAEALSELLASPARRAELGRAARERVRAGFELRQMGDRMHALLVEAVAECEATPRPAPTLGLGRACAIEAIEALRISRALNGLWAETNGATPSAHGRRAADLGRRCYVALNLVFEPAFQWGVRRGWTWMFPVGNRVKRILLRG